MEHQNTIVAPATALGEGGIGIIRISGPGAEEVLLRFFRSSRQVDRLESHRLYHGRVHGPDGETVDEVMAVLMRAPHTYTREDVAEIHCHGGMQVIRRILDLLLEAGTRLARPGEFTLRAFLNGRIDLARAEGVIDVIRSRSAAAHSVALGQMEGRLSRLIHEFRARLADMLAEIETHLDFVEEDIDHPDFSRLIQRSRAIDQEMGRLLGTFDAGRTLRDGLAVLIVGRPNVGKSSLLNALLGESRAIVTALPGTTRDTIEERLEIEGIPVRLVDTAGMRHTEDPIEAEGVRRARDKIASADLVLLVLDGSAPMTRDDLLALEACRESRLLVVLNKADLPERPVDECLRDFPQVRLSAAHGTGMDSLRREMSHFFVGDGAGDLRESVMLSDRRHREALLRAREAVNRFVDSARQDLSPEFLAIEIRDALASLGEITGETTPDEILNKIFSRFCIGK